MEHYRAMKWGAGALVISPLIVFAAGSLYPWFRFNPFVALLVVILLQAYVGFVFYCILCIPVPRRILLLGSVVLILSTGTLLFEGPESAAFVLGLGFVVCILGGLPRWIALGAAVFIVNTLLLLPSLATPVSFWPLVYVFLAYCGLGIAALPHLDWRAHLGTGHRGSREVSTR
ncbi:MAG TPA: hypothetical protein ENN74_03855 [Firmicutes bacterium]|nr:hypothetical protein [Bacillota bacterium]